MKEERFVICKRCGRRLKSEECKIRGYGKVCWERTQKSKEKLKKLFTF